MVGNFSLGMFAWEFSLGIFRLGISVWHLSLGIFRLGSLAWELSLGNFRLGSWAPEAGGTGLLWLGEPTDGSWGDPGDLSRLPGL